eukprot:3498451-Rhodomonas_salina.1
MSGTDLANATEETAESKVSPLSVYAYRHISTYAYRDTVSNSYPCAFLGVSPPIPLPTRVCVLTRRRICVVPARIRAHLRIPTRMRTRIFAPGTTRI